MKHFLINKKKKERTDGSCTESVSVSVALPTHRGEAMLTWGHVPALSIAGSNKDTGVAMATRLQTERRGA